MKIAVCVKHVPDSQSERRFTDSLTVDRAADTGILSELDEYGVEAALSMAEGIVGGAEVHVITMGPAQAEAALRKALQMGADAAHLVCDDAFAGSDSMATSLVLQRAIGILAPDVVITGMSSTDAGMGVIPALLAARMGWPALTLAQSASLDRTGDQDVVTITRDGEDHVETVQAALPAVISVTDQIGEPRYPSFKGIMAAKRKPIATLTLADLGLAADEVGQLAERTRVESASPRPPRTGGERVIDDGSGGKRLATFLAATGRR